jgi:hypothetical protein
LHGFDLTPAMLERFRETLRTRAIEDVDALQAELWGHIVEARR